MLETHAPTLETLFAQLGLDNSQEAIESFIEQHPIPHDMDTPQAPFWSTAQKQLEWQSLTHHEWRSL